MSIIQTFKLNLIPDSAPIVINCDQYDKGTGRLVVKLYEDDIAYTPTGTAVIQGSKPDGHGFAYNATLSGNTVTADLTEQMTAVAGRVRCQVVVTESTGRTGTFVFILDVQRSALPANADMSDSDYQIVQQAIEQSEGWANGEHGGVPVSPDDPAYHNNAKYWADIASQYAQGGIIFKGSVLFANIPTVGMSDGDMYNITDDFTTDARFEEGAGIQCKAGTNIVWNSNSKWDLFATAAIGSLNDMTDVTLNSLVDGQLLKYVTGSSQWVNGWIDYSNANLTGAAEFVNDTADIPQSAHDFGKFFKVKDINNAFGVGSNIWLRGFVVYQNIVSNPYSSITGGGIFFRNDVATPYWFYIGGDGSVGNPFAISSSQISGGGATTLDGLTDVTITTPTDGQTLIYDANSSEWINGNGGGATTLNGLSDVDITSATDGQVLMFDGNANEWVNGNGGGGSSTLGGLTDVTITTPSQGNALTYDAVSLDWINTNLFDSFEGLHGVTEITSQAADLNAYLTEGNYYKAASDFVLTNGPYNDATTRLFMTVKTVKNSGGVVVAYWQEAIVLTTSTSSTVRKYSRKYAYNETTQIWSWSSWDFGTPYSLFSTLNNDVYAIKTSYQSLYGLTAITSSNADLNNYTTPGNYYKSATNFSLSHTPSTNASALAFLRVSTLYEGNDTCIYQTLMIQASSGSALREWYRTAIKSGGTWSFSNWLRNASQSSLESTAGFWSTTVSCLAGDTTATFTDTTYDSSWTYDAYCDDGTGEPIAISKIEVDASDQAVVTFASALANATSVKLHYWK